MHKLIITAVLVLVFGALVWSHLGVSEDGVVITEQTQVDESYTGSFVDDTDKWVEYVSDDIEIAQRLPEPSFDEAFKTAREVLGPGNTFLWLGDEYTTDYLEESVDKSTKIVKLYDSNMVEIIEPVIIEMDITDFINDTLSSLVTPE